MTHQCCGRALVALQSIKQRDREPEVGYFLVGPERRRYDSAISAHRTAKRTTDDCYFEQVSNTRRQKNKKSVNTALFKRNLHVSGIKPIYISFWACIIDRFRCMESCERSWVRIWQSQKFRIWNVIACRYRNDLALLTISRRNYREII